MASKVKKLDESEDNYDDDFEAYGDDFEEEDDNPPKPAAVQNKPKPPPPKPASVTQSNPTTSTYSTVSSVSRSSPSLDINPADIAQLKKSLEIENSEALAKRSSQSKSVDHTQETKSSLRPSRLAAQQAIDLEPQPLAQVKATQKRINKYGSISAASATSMIDPRTRRLARLRSSGVLDLQEEKFSLFNMMPCTQYDLYLRELKHPNSGIKQIGLPVEEEIREVEVGTDDVCMVDKALQVCYGDDTALLNIMRVIKERREEKKISSIEPTPAPAKSSKQSKGVSVSTGTQAQESILEAANITSSGEVGGVSGDNYSSKLAGFLQKSSLLCESILEENSRRREECAKERVSNSQGISKVKSLFSDGSDWLVFGNDSRSGANALVRQRNVTIARFSPLQPNLLITAHPPPVGEAAGDDLRPNKALFCIWDVHASDAPVFVLECSGTPTSCCFSNSQTYIVAGATYEGAIALWDLREANSIHKDRDAIDLGIDRGIRKSSYYTTVSMNAQHDIDVDQHTAPIVQIESVGMVDMEHSSASTVTQYISLDLCGTAILWVSNESNSDDSNLDLGRAPWSKVVLVQIRVLRCDCAVLHGLDLDVGSAPKKSRADRDIFSEMCAACTVSSSSVLATIPGDVSTFLSSASKGKICRLVRYGNQRSIQSAAPVVGNAPSTTQPNQYLGRAAGDSVMIQLDSIRNGNATSSKVEFFAPVSCMHARAAVNRVSGTDSAADATEAPLLRSLFSPLVLVGRVDGSIDLFQVDIQSPLQTWNLSSFNLNGPKHRSLAVVCVKWCSRRASAFFAVDNVGSVYYFDLLVDAFSPIHIEKLSASQLQGTTVDFSSRRTTSRAAYILVADRSGGLNALRVRRLNESFTTYKTGKRGNDSQDISTASELEEEEMSLRAAMSSWSCLTNATEAAVVMQPTTNARK